MLCHVMCYEIFHFSWSFNCLSKVDGFILLSLPLGDYSKASLIDIQSEAVCGTADSFYCTHPATLNADVDAAEVAERQKQTQRSPPKPVTGSLLAGVVVKSLGEIKREKTVQTRHHPPAYETRSKTSPEPVQRRQHDSKIQLYAVPGRTRLFVYTSLLQRIGKL